MTPIFRPVELSVGGIRTVIIDSHNEILPFWFREALDRRCRLIAVRIDAHHDMFQCCPALPSREGWGRFEFMERLLPALQEYSRHSLNEGNFTCPAFHYDVLGALYHSTTSIPAKTGLMPTGQSPGRRPWTLPGRRLSETLRIQGGWAAAEAAAAGQNESSGKKSPPGLRRSGAAAMNAMDSRARMDEMPRQRPSPGG